MRETPLRVLLLVEQAQPRETLIVALHQAFHNLHIQQAHTPLHYHHFLRDANFDLIITEAQSSTLKIPSLPKTLKAWAPDSPLLLLNCPDTAKADISLADAVFDVSQDYKHATEQIIAYIRTLTQHKEIGNRPRKTLQRIHQEYQALLTLGAQGDMFQGSPVETVSRLAEETCAMLDLDRVTIWRRTDSPPEICCLAATGEDAEVFVGQCLPFTIVEKQLEPPVIKSGAVRGTRVIHHNLLSEVVADSTQKACAFLDVPVCSQGKVVGLLTCEMLRRERNWSTETINLVTYIADLAAQIFINASLQRRARELSTIVQINREINGVSDLSQLCRLIARHATETMEIDTGGVFVVTPDNQITLEVYGLDADQEESIREMDLFHQSDELILEALKERQPLLIHNVAQASPTPITKTLTALNMTSLLVVHMFKDDEQIGGIGVGSYSARYFNQEEIAFLKALAQQCVNAVQNARLLYREQQRRELAEALEQAAILVNSNLHPDEVLDSILEQVARVVTGETFNIMLIHEGKAHIERWRGYRTQRRRHNRLATPMAIDRYPVLQTMIRTGEPVVIPNTLQAKKWIVDTDKEWRRSYVGAPIRIGGETVGFLNVNATQPYKFGVSDGERLKAFAAHAATAIHNARLFQKLREYADDLEGRVEARTAELRTQYARLEAVLNSTTDGFIVTDAEGHILQENPVANAWRTQILTQAEAQELEATLEKLARTADRHPDAILELTDLDLQLRAAPVQGSSDDTKPRVIAVHDVSHLKELERMKSQFISNVSHELRTPITTIQLYAQLLRQCPSEKRDEYLVALETEANRQAQLIQDILQFSKLGTKSVELQRRHLNLNELLKDLVQAQEVRAMSKGIALHAKLKSALPPIHADEEKIRQVFLNLIINAIQYTPEGGSVTISTDVTEADAQTWIITQVRDTGIGIPVEELPYIFQRFFRGSVPQQKQIPGTGLGLAITKEIVELHQGWITVESKCNQGSTFTIWLPTAQNPVDAPRNLLERRKDVQA